MKYTRKVTYFHKIFLIGSMKGVGTRSTVSVRIIVSIPYRFNESAFVAVTIGGALRVSIPYRFNESIEIPQDKRLKEYSFNSL